MVGRLNTKHGKLRVGISLPYNLPLHAWVWLLTFPLHLSKVEVGSWHNAMKYAHAYFIVVAMKRWKKVKYQHRRDCWECAANLLFSPAISFSGCYSRRTQPLPGLETRLNYCVRKWWRNLGRHICIYNIVTFWALVSYTSIVRWLEWLSINQRVTGLILIPLLSVSLS